MSKPQLYFAGLPGYQPYREQEVGFSDLKLVLNSRHLGQWTRQDRTVPCNKPTKDYIVIVMVMVIIIIVII